MISNIWIDFNVVDQDGRTRFHYTCYYGYVSVSIPIQLASLALIFVTIWHTSLVFKNVYNLFSPGCKTFQRCFQMTSNSLGLTLNPSPLSHTFVYSLSSKGCRILKRCSISLKQMRSPCRRSSDRCCSEFVTKCEMSIASLLPSNVVTAFPRLLATRHTMLRLTHQ